MLKFSDYMFFPAILAVLILLPSDRDTDPGISSGRASHIFHIQKVSGLTSDLPDPGSDPKLTYPHQAALREYIMTMDPSTRRIPQKRRYLAAREALVRKNLRKLKSDENPIEWKELPANTGGRTRALMFDPTDPEHKKVWAGAVTGGLWYTEDITDHSVTWKPVDDFWENLAIGCICYDPSDPETFYVGTGEGQTAFVTYRESSGTGWGIMRSEDAGKSWELMPSTTGFAYITDIQVRDEAGKSILYVGTKSGEYKGRFFRTSPGNGLFRSIDGGETWTQVLPGIPGRNHSYSVSDIEIASNGRIFVGTTNNLELEGGGRILWSDNGLNWTVVDQHIPSIEAEEVFNIPGRVMLASAPSDPDRIYALPGTGAFGGNGILYIYSRMVMRSEDGGNTWAIERAPLFRNDPRHPANWAYIAWHALTVAVDPEDPDILYVGGCDIHRSDDGGRIWQWISDTQMASKHLSNTCRYVHADQHTLVFRPGSRDILVNANDGGVFYTLNARDSVPCWYERNESFNTMQYYTAALHPGRGEVHYLGGTQDNSTMLYQGEPVTDDGHRYLGGDGAYCFVDRDEPDVHIMSTQWNNYAFTTGHIDSLIGFSSMFKSGLFVNPADYDWRSNILYGNARLQEGGFDDNLMIVRGIPSNASGTFKPVHTGARLPFSAIRLSPHSPAQVPVIYLGTQSGRLFRLRDVLNHVPVPAELGERSLPVANMSCIQVGSTEAELLLTFSNYGVPSVWLSTDGGESWFDREGNLPDIPVRWALWHPENRKYVLLATEVGIWSTDDIFSEEVVWKPELEGLANVRVDMMQFRESDNTVLAATHGRGMFTGVWSVPADTLKPPPLEEGTLNLYPNPSTGMVTLEYNPRWTEKIRIEIYDHTGRRVYREEFKSFAGQYRHTLDLMGLGTGSFICRITRGSETTSHTLLLSPLRSSGTGR